MKRKASGPDLNWGGTKKTKDEVVALTGRFMTLPPKKRFTVMMSMGLESIEILCNTNEAVRAWCQSMNIRERWIAERERRSTSTLLHAPLSAIIQISRVLSFEDLAILEQADPIFERASMRRHLRHYWIEQNMGLGNLKGGPYPSFSGQDGYKLNRFEALAEYAMMVHTDRWGSFKRKVEFHGEDVRGRLDDTSLSVSLFNHSPSDVENFVCSGSLRYLDTRILPSYPGLMQALTAIRSEAGRFEVQNGKVSITFTFPDADQVHVTNFIRIFLQYTTGANIKNLVKPRGEQRRIRARIGCSMCAEPGPQSECPTCGAPLCGDDCYAEHVCD